ncbi:MULTISPECIES: class I SAM-dependent methyltransferase [Chelativorans]|jgi:ubiquinone/menaquinone biosynthesis C-methylase UbiE|uniref:Methyltransferase type 11 n=1 Tax=Chelativorans sp. (strain BNC1) TaxID=266779 RepID=Q11FI1_CHESB|nr:MULTISPECIES: class I SAM-dependent methyltransferase [Chelativorans]
MGTAQVQGELWGAKARDWAELQEPAWQRIYEAAMAHAGAGPGKKLLDVGCGAGGALVVARKLGAEVTGLDGAENLVAIARQRLPGARIDVGEMEELPYNDESFEIVTGINAFQFAADVTRALSEARRVCRRNGTVFILTWGRREDCQLMTITVSAVMALLPPPGGNAPGPLVDEGTIKAALDKAGLQAVETGEFAADLVFPDAETAIRANLAAGVNVKAARQVGEARVREAISATLPSVTRPDGSVVWSNRFRWTMTRRN